MVDEDLTVELAESCLEMAAQDRSAGGLDYLSDKSLIQHRAETEVLEYEKRKNVNLPDDIVKAVEEKALEIFRAQGEEF